MWRVFGELDIYANKRTSNTTKGRTVTSCVISSILYARTLLNWLIFLEALAIIRLIDFKGSHGFILAIYSPEGHWPLSSLLVLCAGNLLFTLSYVETNCLIVVSLNKLLNKRSTCRWNGKPWLWCDATVSGCLNTAVHSSTCMGCSGMGLLLNT